MEDYVELRLGLFVILFLLMALIQFVFFNKQEKIMKYKKYYLIFIFSSSILSMLIFMFPYESVIVKNKVYDTVEEQFQYMYPEYKIEKVFKHDDSAFIYYVHGRSNGLNVAVKEDGKWLFKIPDITFFSHDKYSVDIITTKSSNAYLFQILAVFDEEKVISVIDSNSNVFSDCEVKKLLKSTYSSECYGSVEDVEDDYYLLVDGNKFYLKDMLENGM